MAEVNDIKMYYAEYGEGDPILFIHGGLGNAEVWGHQVADFAKDHLVIVADSRGHGRSTRSQQPFGYDLMTSDYVALLDYLKIDKVTLVGWSDGGIIGIDMAMKHPEKLTRVIAQAANVTTDGVKADFMDNKTFNDYINVARRAVPEAVADAERIRRLRQADLQNVGNPASLDGRRSWQDLGAGHTCHRRS